MSNIVRIPFDRFKFEYEMNLDKGVVSKIGGKQLKPLKRDGMYFYNFKLKSGKSEFINSAKLYIFLKQGIEITDRVIIVKDGDYNNLNDRNIMYGDFWTAIYYKEFNLGLCRFNKNIVGRCSMLPGSDVFEVIESGGVPMMHIPESDGYYIDVTGNVYSSITNKVMKRYISYHGYVSSTITYNGKISRRNVINILGNLFLPNKGCCDTICFKDPTGPRSRTDLKYLEWTTKKKLAERYHKYHPEHYEKYLKNSRRDRNKSINVNGVSYPSIKLAADYIVKDMLSNGIVKTLGQVRSIISIRINKLGSIDKKIYGKYIVSL